MSDETQAVAVREETQVASPGALLGAMLELARDPNFDAVKFEALANLQIKMEDRQAERFLTRDLQAVQRAIPPVERDGRIPKKDGKSIPFATFEAIMAVIQPLLDQYGMTVSFSTRFEALKIVVTGTLRHPAGASMSADVVIPIDEGPGRNTTQAHISSITYGKRVAVKQLFNVIDKGADDSGETSHLKLMTEEQAQELSDLLKVGGGSEARMLTTFYGDKYRSLDEVPADQFFKLKQAISDRNIAAATKRAKEG